MIREGIPSFAILIPSRYLHTPVEVADMNDVNECVKLVDCLVKSAHEFF
jgi:endoglucanase